MKRKLCKFVLALVSTSATTIAFSLSFFSALNVGGSWGALDYWLAWFAFATFLTGCVGMIASVITTISALDAICES